MKMPGAGARRPTPEENYSSSSSPFPLSAEQVYHDYPPRVFSMARRMVQSDVDAEDVTQEVLLQVVRKLPTFRGESAFPTWLHRVTVNAALSHRRRQAVRQEHGLGRSLNAHGEDEPALDPGTRGSLPPDVQIIEGELRQLIEGAVAALPEMYREVFVLADMEGWANADIAAHLNLTLPAVKSRLHRARLLLREVLAPHIEGPSSCG